LLDWQAEVRDPWTFHDHIEAVFVGFAVSPESVRVISDVTFFPLVFLDLYANLYFLQTSFFGFGHPYAFSLLHVSTRTWVALASNAPTQVLLLVPEPVKDAGQGALVVGRVLVETADVIDPQAIWVSFLPPKVWRQVVPETLTVLSVFVGKLRAHVISKTPVPKTL